MDYNLADALYSYAMDHYNDSFGWSVIVECWEIDQIAEFLATNDAHTLSEAIESFSGVVDIWQDRYLDAINSAF